MSNYRVYILQNAQGRRYIGLSSDLLHRLDQHNAGISKWTRHRGPWKLVWKSEQLPLSDARRLENKPKRHGGGHGFYLITKLARTDGS